MTSARRIMGKFGDILERCKCPIEGCDCETSREKSAILNHLTHKHPGLGTRERALLADKAMGKVSK